MRSRFAAFAVGLGPYLVSTLAAGHADLELPREELVRELSQARARQRFLGLRILFAGLVAADQGEVLFFARIFEKGQDRSFAELSRFLREDGLWRYASGICVPKADLPEDLAGALDAAQLTPARAEEVRKTFGLLTSARLLGSRRQ